MDEKQIKKLAKEIASEIKKQEKKPKSANQKDWRLRNTKLLLANYIFLVKHCSEIKEDLTEYENVVFDPEELNLRALMKYKAKTKKMIDYFEAVWGSYKKYSIEKGGNVERRCKVIEKLYLGQTSLKNTDLAELFNVDESTVRRDEKKATSELSVFLFGVDTLEDLVDAVFMP